MRALFILPLLLLGCDSSAPPVDPDALSLPDTYDADWSGPNQGTATWEIDGTDVTLHLVIAHESGITNHTLRGTYFPATTDMRLTGDFDNPTAGGGVGWHGTAVYEGRAFFGGERIEGSWVGTYDLPSPIVVDYGLVLTRR